LTILSHESAIIAIFAAVMISFPMAFGLMFQANEAQAQDFSTWGGAYGYVRAPVAISGTKIYTAWNNVSATLHGVAVFFTKSNDGGKTFANTMVLSPP
jgi:urea transporter